MQQFKKGLALYSVAKDRARELGLPSNAVKMKEMICSIQEKEGNTPCFGTRTSCNETSCCWQASCGARMVIE